MSTYDNIAVTIISHPHKLNGKAVICVYGKAEVLKPLKSASQTETRKLFTVIEELKARYIFNGHINWNVRFATMNMAQTVPIFFRENALRAKVVKKALSINTRPNRELFQ